jgi:dienelactone hydrolase
MLGVASASCALLAGHVDPIPADDYLRSDTYMREQGYNVMADAGGVRPTTYGSEVQRVYVTGSTTAPPIVLFHELPGLRPEDVELGRELGHRFHVYVPLLFGVAGQNSNRMGYAEACSTNLFSCNSTTKPHRILGPLRDLVKVVCHVNCGIVGMCLTGSLPLALMTTNDHIMAIVVAQPSLPFFHPIWPFRPRLDVSTADLNSAIDAAIRRSASIYLTRYRHDLISSHRTFELLASTIGARVASTGVRFKVLEIPGHGHSTLVRDGGHALESELEFSELVSALNAGLRRSSS